MNRHGPMRRCMGGFSLLEVLVAFTILALTLGVLWQIFSATAQRATVVQDTHRAVMLAESKMSELALTDVVRAGADAGEVDATFRWQRHVEPLEARRADRVHVMGCVSSHRAGAVESPRSSRLWPGRPAAIRRTHDRAHGGGRVKHWRHSERALAARGFTLVELVIALSILGILSLLLVNGLGLATRTWDAVEQRTTEAHQGHLSVIFLQRQIELAQPLRLSRDASAKQITFVGQQHA